MEKARRQLTYMEDPDSADALASMRMQISDLKRRSVSRSEVMRVIVKLGLERVQDWTTDEIRRYF